MSGCLIVVMADRGARIEKKLSSREEVITLLTPFMKYMEEMVGVMFHGDFLPHHFVMDALGTLHVIDHDEGGVDEVGRRALDYKDKETDWYAVIRYPNALRYDTTEKSIQKCSSRPVCYSWHQKKSLKKTCKVSWALLKGLVIF